MGLWRNYLILCCSSASSSPSMSSSSSTSGSVRCSPPETLASTPDSGYSYDSKVSGVARRAIVKSSFSPAVTEHIM